MDDVLGNLPLFAALDDDADTALRGAMRHEQFARGDVIFDEGDAGDKLYAVIEGKVKLARTAPDGRENLQAVLGPGEMFGELSLFDPKPRTAGAVAVTDTVLASLAHEDLRPWITGRPDVAVQLLAGVGATVAAHQRRARRPGLQRRAVAGGQGAAASSPTGSVKRPPKACTSRTTSPKKSWPNSSALRAKRSTRRWPISPPADGCASNRARSSSATSTA